MLVRGVQLVEQASRRLFHEGVAHGCRQATHWNRNHNAKIQLCSVDTLIARNDRPEADLIVVDEAHMAVSGGFKKVLEDYPNAYILSVTATPYGTESLRHLADVVVHPISIEELIEQKYLCPPRYYAPSAPDLKGVKVSNGDYVNGQLEERMNTLTGDIVSHWKTLGENRPTLCFAVNIAHSKSIVAQFNACGIAAEHIEGDHTLEERDAAIERLRTGEIKILSNVGVLTTGVDIVFASAIIMARPTRSYNLYIQIAGRGTRTCEGKENFLILDHASNVMRHGFITDEPEVDLDGRKKKQKEPSIRTCPVCFVVYEGPSCFACGFAPADEPKDVNRNIENEVGILEEIKDLPEAVQISIFIKRCKDLAKRRGYHHGYVYHRVKERFGEAVASQAFPNRKKNTWVFK